MVTTPRTHGLALVVLVAVMLCACLVWFGWDAGGATPESSPVLPQPVEKAVSPSPESERVIVTAKQIPRVDDTKSRHVNVQLVDDLTSRPVANAPVHEVANRLVVVREDLVVLTASDEQGQFSVATGNSITILHPDYQAKMLGTRALRAGADTTNGLVVRLRLKAVLTVRCVFPDGRPAKECIVSAHSVIGVDLSSLCGAASFADMIGLDAVRAPHLARTGEGGIAVLPSLAEERYVLNVDLPGYCSDIAGSRDSIITAPADRTVTMMPIYVARATVPAEWGSFVSTMTRTAIGVDSTGAASRMALRLVPELANEQWVARVCADEAQPAHEELFVASSLGHLVTERIAYAPLNLSKTTILSDCRPTEQVYPIRIDVLDLNGSPVDVPLRLVWLHEDGRAAARASSKLAKGGALSLARGRYKVRVNDVGREWFSEMHFSVPDDDGIVTLQSEKALQSCIIGIRPPAAYTTGSWRLSIAMRGYKTLHRQMDGQAPQRMWLPLGEGLLRAKVPGLHNAEMPLRIRPTEKSSFVLEMQW